MKLDRRKFLKLGVVTGAGAVGLGGGSGNKAEAAEAAAGEEEEFVGVLHDTTRCIGCRKCEAGCARANGLPVPDIDDKTVFHEVRDMRPDAWTVVNRFETEKGIVHVKKQCNHCNQAGCAAACLVRAMYKTKPGPVIWRESKCMGCRYCMISCPFEVPKFEYDKAIPRIQKCTMCFDRQQKGFEPACVEACPVDALTFGTRREILNIARGKIVANPGNYVNHIYGEREAGGTGWLYLAGVPFDQIGFRTNVGTTPYPEYTKGFLYTVPVIFVLWPTFMLGLHQLSKRKEAGEEKATKDKK